jgi:hypothetical protein
MRPSTSTSFGCSSMADRDSPSAHNLVNLPITAEGFLNPTRESPTTWVFDFESHDGKHLELAPFDTSCLPHPYFVSRSDFVAFGCRGSESRLQFSGFNLLGENKWVQVLGGQQAFPSIVAASATGRFALSRILISDQTFELENLVPEQMTAQEVSVIQSHDGRILLKTQTSPIQRAGQNFDLSPDGLRLAVIRAARIDLLRLPPLTPKDVAEVKRGESSVPERSQAEVLLRPQRPGGKPLKAAEPAGSQTAGTVEPTAETSASPNAAPESASPSVAVQSAEAPANVPPVVPASGDAASGTTPKVAPKQAPPTPEVTEPDAPRKPPSLYDEDHPRPPK